MKLNPGIYKVTDDLLIEIKNNGKVIIYVYRKDRESIDIVKTVVNGMFFVIFKSF